MNIVKPFPLFLSPVCQRREGKEAATAGERVLLERRRHLPPSPTMFCQREAESSPGSKLALKDVDQNLEEDSVTR